GAASHARRVSNTRPLAARARGKRRQLSRPPRLAPAAPPLQGAALDAGVEVRRRVVGPLARPPEADERLLDHVLGVGAAGRPLAGEQHQRGAVLREPGGPLLRGRHAPASAGSWGVLLGLCRTPAVLSTPGRFFPRLPPPPPS